MFYHNFMSLLSRMMNKSIGRISLKPSDNLYYGFTLLILFAVLIFAACSGSHTQLQMRPEMIARYTKNPVIIDGRLDEQIWQKSQMVMLKNNKTGDNVSDSLQQTEVRTCYNDSCLYISFVCHDMDIWGNYSKHDQHLWEEEAVEVFIDTDKNPATYIEIEVSPRNVLFDSYIVDPKNIDIAATKSFDLPGIQTAVLVQGTLDNKEDTDHSWKVEIAVPFTDLSIKENYASPDSLWRINFYRINRDRNSESASYAWSPTYQRFHKPSAFGILKFREK